MDFQKILPKNKILLKNLCKNNYSGMFLPTAVLALILLPLCTGHLGSLAHNGKERNESESKRKQDIREIIYCYFVKQGGEGKPPLLNHVRVSRGPLDEYKSMGPSTGRMNLIKSPSYQHKMLHMSQFHNSNPAGGYQNDYHNGGLSNPIYPVASVYMRNGVPALNPTGKSGFNSNGELVPEEHHQKTEGGDYLYSNNNNLDESVEEELLNPAFSPFIGARSLSNLPKFFEHIRENLDALHLSQQLENMENENDSAPKEYLEEQKDLPERRGDYFMSDGRLSVNADEYDRPVIAEEPRMRTNSPRVHDASRELDLLMGRDPKYKKANQYNPSWLFTNLGLGKRSHL